MSDSEDDRLQELREEKLEELQDQADQDQQQAGQEEMQAQQEAQKQAMLRKHLTDGARKRLNTVEMSKPEFAKQAEQQILALAQSGRLQGQKIDEAMMKEILQELRPESKSFDISHR